MPLNALSLVVSIKEKSDCATLIRGDAQVEPAVQVRLVQADRGPRAEAPTAARVEGGGSPDRLDGNSLMGEATGDCSAKAAVEHQDVPSSAPAESEKNAAPPAQQAASPAPGGKP